MEGGSSSGSGSSDVGIPALPSLSVTYWRTPCLLGPACQLLNGFGHVRGSSSVVYSVCFYLLRIKRREWWYNKWRARGRDVGLLSTAVPQASENARRSAFHSVSNLEGPACRAATRMRQERCTIKTDWPVVTGTTIHTRTFAARPTPSTALKPHQISSPFPHLSIP